MKTNIKVVALGLSGVFVVGGILARVSTDVPRAPQEPVAAKVVYSYGVKTLDTPSGLELAKRVHGICNTAKAFRSTELNTDCKVRVMKELME